MPPEELKKHPVKILVGVEVSGEACCGAYEDHVHVHEECRQILATLHAETIPLLNGVEASCRIGALTKIVGSGSRLIETIRGQFAAAVDHEVAAAAEPPEDFDPVNLLALPYIPQSLEHDLLFSKLVCPITQRPIRHPVGDPNGITVYERDMMIQVLRRDPRSPITRAPLHPEDLRPLPRLQALIDDRLAMYQQRIQGHLDRHEHEPLHPNLAAGAREESPRLDL